MFDPQQHPYAQNTPGYASSEEKTWAVIAHLAPLIGYVAVVGQIVIPLIILLVKGSSSEFVREHAKEALNFQISLAIYFIISAALLIVLIGFVLAAVVGVFGLVGMITAALKASSGESYRYPGIIRFVP